MSIKMKVLSKLDTLLMFEIKKINRWLKWTGFRLTVEVDKLIFADESAPVPSPTKVGLTWWGWKDLF